MSAALARAYPAEVESLVSWSYWALSDFPLLMEARSSLTVDPLKTAVDAVGIANSFDFSVLDDRYLSEDYPAHELGKGTCMSN